MRIEVNGVRLFFDVEGAKLVPDGPAMREKPTLILLHGGPGADHSIYKPDYSQFADIAQVIYLDHRGNGRSDREPREAWNPAQWGDDVFEFCCALEIERPIVLGESFGGYVAISYATRHPEHPSKLILVSTSVQGGRPYVERSIELFGQFGGAELADLARRHLINPTPETRAQWVAKALPFYDRHAPRDRDRMQRAVLSSNVIAHFQNNELKTFDLRSELARIGCPTLVIGGEEDPQTPIESQADIAAGISQTLVRFERIPNAGHGARGYDPGRVFGMIREFILSGESKLTAFAYGGDCQSHSAASRSVRSHPQLWSRPLFRRADPRNRRHPRVHRRLTFAFTHR
jgi:proline iminopeptidase